MEVTEFFRVPVVPLGGADAESPGIYVPEAEVGLAPVGLTEQFLGKAGTYHERYTNTAYFKALIGEALRRIGSCPPRPRILDIGSGSGNSVFPCLELFPDCRIVATDLSPVLLKILFDHVTRDAHAADRVLPVCMDATNDYYRENAFDLVIGAAILHHLIDPGTAIRAAARTLAPGGHAIFFEPFENGNAILRIAYTQILERQGPAEKSPLPPEIRSMLKAMVADYEVRTGTDKSGDVYRRIDDKWLFTRSYIEERARQAGFTQVTIYPLHDIERPFSRQTEVNLQLALAAPRERLPAWAWDILDYFDRVFSAEMKRDLMIEGCIILGR